MDKKVRIVSPLHRPSITFSSKNCKSDAKKNVSLENLEIEVSPPLLLLSREYFFEAIYRSELAATGEFLKLARKHWEIVHRKAKVLKNFIKVSRA